MPTPPAPPTPPSLSLGEVRRAFPARCYERSAVTAWAWLLFDAAVYLVAVTGAVLAPGVVLRLTSGVVAGGATAALFVWAHDACHGALFRSARWSRVLATLAMLPSLQMERLWAYGHNRVHHGFTSLMTVDWIWRPWSPAEYRAARPRDRLLYRLERRPATCSLHYLLRVWWPAMVCHRGGSERGSAGFRTSKAVTAAFAAALGSVAWWFGGPVSVLAALLVPFAVFTHTISLFVFLHHTHPDLPFYADRSAWSATTGQLRGSTTIRCSRPVERLTHGILLHTPHHVDARIPFYRLPLASAALTEAHGDEIVSYRFRWSTVRRVFATCQLFDPETGTWSPAPSLSPSAPSG